MPVDSRVLNRIFNDHAYFERFQRGEFIACLKKETNATSLDEPPGTRSLTVWYMDREGNRICLVHFYLRPNLSIGGRPPFRPEPKMLIHEGTRYELA